MGPRTLQPQIGQHGRLGDPFPVERDSQFRDQMACPKLIRLQGVDMESSFVDRVKGGQFGHPFPRFVIQYGRIGKDLSRDSPRTASIQAGPSAELVACGRLGHIEIGP